MGASGSRSTSCLRGIRCSIWLRGLECRLETRTRHLYLYDTLSVHWPYVYFTSTKWSKFRQITSAMRIDLDLDSLPKSSINLSRSTYTDRDLLKVTFTLWALDWAVFEKKPLMWKINNKEVTKRLNRCLRKLRRWFFLVDDAVLQRLIGLFARRSQFT